MKKRVYAIHDDKVGSFGQPVVGENDAAMVRSFGDLVTGDNKSLYAMHREDFSIWYLGEFNDETGLFIQDELSLKKLASGSDFAKE